MSRQRPCSRPAAAARVAIWMKRVVMGSFKQTLILCALIPCIAVLGACGQRVGEPSASQPPPSTATPLPAVPTSTPQPPAATSTPAPTPAVTAPATATPPAAPTPAVTGTPPAAAEPPPTADPGEETAAPVPAPLNAVLTVGGEMNIRSGPGEEYDRIGGASAGEEFRITGKNEDGNWWQIDFGGEIAWIYAPFVTAANAENVPVVGGSMAEPPPPAPRTGTAAPQTQSAAITVLGDMNVRSGPGTAYDRIGGAAEGETFAITGKSQDGQWWQIDFDGRSGWIFAPYVLAANVENVPVVTDPQAEGTETGSTETGGTETGDPTTETPAGPLATTAGDLNVRAGPGTEYDRIGGANEGEEFAITGRSSDGEWWRIDFEGRSGWLYAPFVLAANAENVPVVTPEDQGSAPADAERPAVVAGDSTAVAADSEVDALGVRLEEE